MRLQQISGRFTGIVYPGETLVVEMWQNGSDVVFMTKTKERGDYVLKGTATVKAAAKM